MSDIRIMIVEDEWVIADDIQRSLRTLGYNISSVAASGEDAIKKAGKDKPGLVLMDIVLQGEMDGVEAASQIRNLFDIPVIYLTAITDMKVLERAKVTGPFGYMIKPFEDRELQGNIEMALFKHKMEKELRQAKEEAGKAIELKDKFVSLAAHDLRSPLATILGFLKYILKDKEQPLHEKHREIIERVIDQGEGLNDLIHELLDVSKLKTGIIKPHPVFIDGNIVATNAVTNLKHPAKVKDITLTCDIPKGTRLYTDPILFQQVVQNLLSNAVKFCRKKDSITLFVPSGESTTIAVRDTGVGIMPDRRLDLFKYEECTSTPGTSGERGTGLGLPLCRDIMEAHGGKLDYESAPGEGSVFYARLPMVPPVVLVVDDDSSIRLKLRRLLEKVGSQILEAENGKEALTLLSETPPHLIVADINMPVMDGFDLLENIRYDLSLRHIPIIILTADDQETTREKVFSLGANDFVNKPVMSADFIPRVRRYIG